MVLAQQAAALAFAVLLAAVVARRAVPAGTSADRAGVWLGAAASGVLYYGAGFWFFVTGLRRVPASVAGSFLPLIPVFGVAAGFLVGERLEPRQWVGAVVIVAATAAIALRQRSAEAVEPAPHP